MHKGCINGGVNASLTTIKSKVSLEEIIELQDIKKPQKHIILFYAETLQLSHPNWIVCQIKKPNTSS